MFECLGLDEQDWSLANKGKRRQNRENPILHTLSSRWQHDTLLDLLESHS